MPSWDTPQLLGLFEELVDLPTEEQRIRVKEIGREDGALGQELERLLDADRNPLVTGIQGGVGPHDDDASSLTPTEGIPDRVAGYDVLGQLGRGSYGLVMRVRRSGVAGEAALKLMGQPLAEPVVRRRFEREAAIMTRLDHEAIPRIHEAGEVILGGASQLYLVMDIVEGGPLIREADKQSLDLEARIRIVIQVCGALQYVHELGVVHRDLKPGNILLTKGGSPKLIDFGIAQAEPGGTVLTQSGDALGTPSYMSPEQVRGERGLIDARADVYGMGALLYELICGVPPFGAATQDLFVLVQRVLDEAPLRPSQVRRSLPRSLDWICLRALEKDPSQRYHSAAALAEDLERYLSGLTPDAQAPRPWVRAAKWSRNHPLAASVILTFVVLGARELYVENERVQAAHGLWRNGDLVGSQSEWDQVSPWVHLLATPPESQDGADQDRSDLIQDLLGRAEIRTEDALWFAATHVERDGPQAQPELVRYLAFELGLALERQGSEHLSPPALSAIARLAFDRPASSQHEFAAFAPIREVLDQCAWGDLSVDGRFNALIALGGIGGVRSLESIREWVDSDLDRDRPNDRTESFRVATTNAESIIRRLHRFDLATGSEAKLISWYGLVERMCRELTHYSIRAEGGTLVQSLALLGRSRGLSQPEVSLKGWWGAQAACVEAIRGAQLTHAELFRNILELLPHGDAGSMRNANTLYESLYYLGEGEPPKALVDQFAGVCASKGISEGRVQGVRTEAKRRYLERIEGIRSENAPDEDTHLGYLAGNEEPRWREVATISAEGGSATLASAEWNLRTETPTRSGAAIALSMADVHTQEDENVQGEYFARLAPRAQSQIAFDFDLGDSPTRHVRSIAVQLTTMFGMRRQLPNNGKALLQIYLDRRQVAEVDASHLDQTSTTTIPLPIRGPIQGEHRLTLAMHPESTTTLRVSEVRVRIIED